MEYGSETLAALVKAFSRLPGIGAKTAQRLALFLLRSKNDHAETLGELQHISVPRAGSPPTARAGGLQPPPASPRESDRVPFLTS